MRYDIVIIISLVLMLVLSRQDYERKIAILIKIIRRQRAESAVLARTVSALEDLILRERGEHPPLPASQPDRWKRAWAREFLRITHGPLTPEVLRAARREAIKREHPDAGGTDERMRMIEEAFDALSR